MLPTALRAALIVFVLAAIFGPYEVRSAIPVWIAFLVALGLEINFLLGALGRPPRRRPTAGRRRSTGSSTATAGRSRTTTRTRTRTTRSRRSSASARRCGSSCSGIAVHRRARAPLARREPHRLGLAQRGDRTRGAGPLLAGGLDDRRQGGARPLRRVRRSTSAPSSTPTGSPTVGGDLTYLTPERCLDLYRLAFEGEVTGSQTGRALAVLAHEAWHLRGVRNEGTAECYAFQSGVALGQRLGLSEDAARPADEPAAGRERRPQRRGRRVPRPAGLPRRRRARPRPGELAVPLEGCGARAGGAADLPARRASQEDDPAEAADHTPP